MAAVRSRDTRLGQQPRQPGATTKSTGFAIRTCLSTANSCFGGKFKFPARIWGASLLPSPMQAGCCLLGRAWAPRKVELASQFVTPGSKFEPATLVRFSQGATAARSPFLAAVCARARPPSSAGGQSHTSSTGSGGPLDDYVPTSMEN